MLTVAQTHRPSYFLAAFGQRHAGTHPLEGGVYPHLTTLVTKVAIQAGDVVILYCTGGYPGHDQEAPGIGVVTGLGKNKIEPRLTDINYQYLPLCHPISLQALRAAISRLKINFSLPAYLLQDIGQVPFRAAIAGRQIDWP